jgi:hypothetical protein
MLRQARASLEKRYANYDRHMYVVPGTDFVGIRRVSRIRNARMNIYKLGVSAVSGLIQRLLLAKAASLSLSEHDLFGSLFVGVSPWGAVPGYGSRLR